MGVRGRPALGTTESSASSVRFRGACPRNRTEEALDGGAELGARDAGRPLRPCSRTHRRGDERECRPTRDSPRAYGRRSRLEGLSRSVARAAARPSYEQFHSAVRSLTERIQGLDPALPARRVGAEVAASRPG